MYQARQTTIPDRDVMAVIIQRSVEESFGGSQRQAARVLAGPRAPKKEVGRLQQLINRLAHKKTGRITDLTLRWIKELVGPERQDGLRQALFPTAAQSRLARYRRWMERELARTRTARHLENQLRQVPENQLRRKHPEVFKMFQEFDRFLEGMHHIAPRAELALREVLAPLTRDGVSGGIERGAFELSLNELRHYLRHAFAAQRVLLRRNPDVERAMKAAWGAEATEKGRRAIAEQEATREARRLKKARRHRGQESAVPSNLDPPKLGWRVTGEARPPKSRPRPAVRSLAERRRLLRRCKSLEALNRLVDLELGRPTPPRPTALRLFLEAARRLEAAKRPKERKLSNELTAVLANLETEEGNPGGHRGL